jgi:hypothetical protein
MNLIQVVAVCIVAAILTGCSEEDDSLPMSDMEKKEYNEMVDKLAREHGKKEAEKIVSQAAKQAKKNQLETSAKGSVTVLASSCASFYALKGEYPKSLKELLKSGVPIGSAAIGASGSPLIDPWGTPYKLTIQKEEEKAIVISAGPDTKFDTSDDIRSN